MPNYLVTFISLNQVSLIRRRLTAAGAYAEMIRTPQCLAIQGCGFGLRCDRDLLGQITGMARSTGIAIQGVFKEEVSANEVPSYIALTEEDLL